MRGSMTSSVRLNSTGRRTKELCKGHEVDRSRRQNPARNRTRWSRSIRRAATGIMLGFVPQHELQRARRTDRRHRPRADRFIGPGCRLFTVSRMPSITTSATSRRGSPRQPNAWASKTDTASVSRHSSTASGRRRPGRPRRHHHGVRLRPRRSQAPSRASPSQTRRLTTPSREVVASPCKSVRIRGSS